MPLWFVLGMMTGVLLGWWAKRALIVGLVEVVRSHNYYLVMLGHRIIKRTRSRAFAHTYRQEIIHELGGRGAKAAEDQREPGKSPDAERQAQGPSFGVVAERPGPQEGSPRGAARP